MVEVITFVLEFLYVVILQLFLEVYSIKFLHCEQ